MIYWYDYIWYFAIPLLPVVGYVLLEILTNDTN
jgi:hypothetical protein